MCWAWPLVNFFAPVKRKVWSGSDRATTRSFASWSGVSLAFDLNSLNSFFTLL